MTKTQLLRRAKRRLDGLSERHLATAEDFLAYLEEREENEATEELLRIPGLVDEVKAAREEVARGDVTPLKDIQWKE